MRGSQRRLHKVPSDAIRPRIPFGGQQPRMERLRIRLSNQFFRIADKLRDDDAHAQRRSIHTAPSPAHCAQPARRQGPQRRPNSDKASPSQSSCGPVCRVSPRWIKAVRLHITQSLNACESRLRACLDRAIYQELPIWIMRGDGDVTQFKYYRSRAASGKPSG